MVLLDVVTFPLSVNITGVAPAWRKTILDLDLVLSSLSALLHFLLLISEGYILLLPH